MLIPGGPIAGGAKPGRLIPGGPVGVLHGRENHESFECKLLIGHPKKRSN